MLHQECTVTFSWSGGLIYPSTYTYKNCYHGYFLASLMNLLHQHIYHIFLIKWGNFWLALFLNFRTNPINNSKIKINRKSTSRRKWINWPLFLYNLEMISQGVACIWYRNAEESDATTTGINQSSSIIGCWGCNNVTFHDYLGVMCDVHMLFQFCVAESSSIQKSPVARLFSARMTQISDVC